MFASCFTVPALALLYFILLSLGYAEGVYYVALAAKLSLWALGHKIILTSHGPKPGSGYRAVQTRSMA